MEHMLTEEAKAKAKETRKLTPLERARLKPKSRALAMKAKCWDCMGGYADGRYDCEITDCGLYEFMPYKGKKRPE
jgi:hypothetical protein